MAGEWEQIEQVPAELPDGQTVDVKLYLRLADIESENARLVPNPGLQPLALADSIGSDEFLRLCMLNAGELFESNFVFLNLPKVRIASR